MAEKFDTAKDIASVSGVYSRLAALEMLLLEIVTAEPAMKIINSGTKKHISTAS